MLRPNTFSVVHFDSIFSNLSIISLILGKNLALISMATSSEYAATFVPPLLRAVRISLIFKFQSKGCITPPCGLPAFQDCVSHSTHQQVVRPLGMPGFTLMWFNVMLTEAILKF